MSDDKPESPKDAARRHMELSRALDEPERREEAREWFIIASFQDDHESVKGPRTKGVQVIERSAYDALKAHYETVERALIRDRNEREAHLTAELATLKRERDELKTLVEKNEGRIKAIVDEELLDSNQRLIAENAKLREELLQSQRETNRAADQITSLRRELEELKAEADIRKAQLWVAKDSQLRTYDGLTTRHDRYRTALSQISGRPMSWETAKRIADEAIGGEVADKKENVNPEGDK